MAPASPDENKSPRHNRDGDAMVIDKSGAGAEVDQGPLAKKRKLVANTAASKDAAAPTTVVGKGKAKAVDAAEDFEDEFDDIEAEAMGSFEHVLERLGKKGGGTAPVLQAARSVAETVHTGTEDASTWPRPKLGKLDPNQTSISKSPSPLPLYCF